jgi:hypothetical protein
VVFHALFTRQTDSAYRFENLTYEHWS